MRRTSTATSTSSAVRPVRYVATAPSAPKRGIVIVPTTSMSSAEMMYATRCDRKSPHARWYAVRRNPNKWMNTPTSKST
jgi:hypothetical protein